ncbi:helix-turn-helix transcriptional regulator [Streptomyces sp. TS71-3]|uniref:helix-turn-helix domain-containing protein n=1 Tax=Streptomyces sp. TS71-3 TaxID=2733862 RepID=UPI001B29D444|nr:helix-turn-helix transcriptional regulator [Streptomyces sp. TS71-3]GHJ35414.1 transcriptional regulator [Streptomyces sp. TS71-3]
MSQKPKPLDDTVSLHAWFGVEVRNWRNQRGLSTAELGRRINVSASLIERIEKGTRSCGPARAAALDEALEAGGALIRLWRRVEEDADNVHRGRTTSPLPNPVADGTPKPMDAVPEDPDTLPGESETTVERRSFLAAASGTAMSATPMGLVPTLGHGALPKAVRPQDIEQVRAASTTLSGWDNLYGGAGMVREACTGQLTWASRLLHVRCPASLKEPLFTAVGDLAVVMGAAAFDAYEHNEARRLLKFAVECAEHVGNWHLRANAQNWRARQAIWVGAPDEGLTHAEQGLVRADRLTPREQAMLHNARARALAKMRDVQSTLAAIGRSDEVFSHARTGEDQPWMAYYDRAQHHGDTGHALYDATLLSGYSPRPAADRFRVAITGHRDTYLRSRAISGTKLASLTMATGDPREAVAIAHKALKEAGRVSSKRTLDDVRDLRRLSLNRTLPQGELHQLREHIDTTVLS